MSMMAFFCAVFFFPRDVLGEILNLIESFCEGFPTYSLYHFSYSSVFPMRQRLSLNVEMLVCLWLLMRPTSL